jgi:hypothetical protein
MSKFLLNIFVQISKALVNSKIQFLIQKSFFFAFGPGDLAAHSAFGPAGSRWPKPLSRARRWHKSRSALSPWVHALRS